MIHQFHPKGPKNPKNNAVLRAKMRFQISSVSSATVLQNHAFLAAKTTVTPASEKCTDIHACGRR